MIFTNYTTLCAWLINCDIFAIVCKYFHCRLPSGCVYIFRQQPTLYKYVYTVIFSKNSQVMKHISLLARDVLFSSVQEMYTVITKFDSYFQSFIPCTSIFITIYVSVCILCFNVIYIIILLLFSRVDTSFDTLYHCH